MKICTERLIIRRFTPEDWKGLYGYLSDERVVEFEPYGVFSEEDCRIEAARRAEQDCFYAVCLAQSGVLIGNIYLARQEPEYCGNWELGYVFHSEYQGKGYAAESCRAVLRHAIQTLGARRFAAMCDPQNVRSWRLLERLGFRREGHLLQDIYFKTDEKGAPLWKDTYLYGILADEWLKKL